MICCCTPTRVGPCHQPYVPGEKPCGEITLPHPDSSDLLDRLTSASYSEAELNQVIDYVWALDEKHPTLWTGIAKKLIITMMRDRMMEKRNV